MPSKNNKNKKNVKVNTNGNTASNKAPEKKTQTKPVKPYFFDKAKIDFAFSEKKSVTTSDFVAADETSDKGFVSAHFYHANSSEATPFAAKQETIQTEIVDGEKSSTMKELLSGDIGKDIPQECEIIDDAKACDVFPDLSDDGACQDEKKEEPAAIGMKELFEEPQEQKGESKAQEQKVIKEIKAAMPEFLPIENDARKENEAILSSLTPDDIKNKTDEKKKSGAAASFLRFLAMTICFIVLVVSSINLVTGFVNKARDREKNEELRDSFNSGEIGYTTLGYAKKNTELVPDERLYSDEGTIYKAPEPEVFDMHQKYERMLPNLQALKYVNSSAFAWIKVSGTRVDYPVVRSPQGDNDYYLSHGIDRTYSVSGAVFTDFNNSTKLSNNKNTCVYGHNMNDGTMFQTIMNFKEKNQFLNSTIEMYTAEGIYVYIPYAVYDALPTESFFKTEFSSDEEFLSFLDEIKSKSIFVNKDVKTDKNSKVVTLITCTNTVTDKRFVVHGVLKEVVK